ncbi:DUF7715 family protein [Streptomyces rhizosphaericus]|uniref:DUF7715 family protein n=1 Tax=Streptomyces rhizosphaericus TaxID=114699 RepID=UPI000A3AA4A6|nr:hypothetical protein [Streptomyces rhizosphaericus]
MKLLITAVDSNFRTSDTDYSWTDPGEVLTVGTDGAFVGVDSGRFTTRGRVADVALSRVEVRQKIITYLTRGGWYEPRRERQSTETRKRMAEVFGLARGFAVGTVLELHEGMPRPFTGSATSAAS